MVLTHSVNVDFSRACVRPRLWLDTPAGGDDVNFSRLRRVSALFENHWDSYVIASLAVRGPLRFSQLSHEVTRNSGERIPDTSLRDSKDRLIRSGLVTATDDGRGHPVYGLTAKGEVRVAIIESLVDALPDEDNDRQPSSAS